MTREDSTTAEVFDGDLDLGPPEEPNNIAGHRRDDQAPQKGSFARMLKHFVMGVGAFAFLIIGAVIYVRGLPKSTSADVIIKPVDILEARPTIDLKAGASESKTTTTVNEKNPPPFIQLENKDMSAEIPLPDASREKDRETIIDINTKTLERLATLEQQVKDVAASIDALEKSSIVIEAIKVSVHGLQQEVLTLMSTQDEKETRVAKLETHHQYMNSTIAEVEKRLQTLSAIPHATPRHSASTAKALSTAATKTPKEILPKPTLKPPFSVSAVTQWGEDTLATVFINGNYVEVGEGSVVTGWLVKEISMHRLSVKRLLDGATYNVQTGRED